MVVLVALLLVVMMVVMMIVMGHILGYLFVMTDDIFHKQEINKASIIRMLFGVIYIILFGFILFNINVINMQLDFMRWLFTMLMAMLVFVSLVCFIIMFVIKLSYLIRKRLV